MDDARHSHHELRIARIVQETADARSFVLEVSDALQESFRYQAGQFLTFEVPWGETTLGRCYSLSSSPHWEDEHKVTVKRVDQGRVSNWFHDELSVGDRVRVLPPAGRFVLRTGSERPLSLFGGGSGITPLISLVKSALATTERRIKLVYANRDRASVIFEQELQSLLRRHRERLEIVHHLDAEHGFLEAGGVMRQVAGWEESDFYLCGPGPFMGIVEDSLRGIGIGRERILIERFVSPADGERPLFEMGEFDTEGAVPKSITIHLDGRTHQVPYEPGRSLLATARAAGLEPPFACEDGYCGCCMARLVRGEVSMAQCSALDEDEVAEGWILTCQARPTSKECEVRYEE